MLLRSPSGLEIILRPCLKLSSDLFVNLNAICSQASPAKRRASSSRTRFLSLAGSACCSFGFSSWSGRCRAISFQAECNSILSRAFSSCSLPCPVEVFIPEFGLLPPVPKAEVGLAPSALTTIVRAQSLFFGTRAERSAEMFHSLFIRIKFHTKLSEIFPG